MQTTLQNHSINSNKILADFDLFTLLKLDHLTPQEKSDRLLEMSQIVMTNFINQDLPLLLNESDMQHLEKLSDEQSTDAVAIQDFLREKVADFDQIILHKTLELKKQLVVSQYEKELALLEKEQKNSGVNRMEQILAVQRILQAIQFNDWELVTATIPHTRISS